MAEQDDVLHLIDDTGTVPEDSSARRWKIAVISSMAPKVPPWIAGRKVLPISESW